MTVSPSLADRIRDRIRIEDHGHITPCWISTRAAQPNGYTKIAVAGRTMLTHRAAYEAIIGPIAHGLEIDHLCRMRACCNPDHLEQVSGRENRRRSDSLAAREARQEACHRGHPFTPENTYQRTDRTGRICRTCGRERAQRARQPRDAELPRHP